MKSDAYVANRYVTLENQAYVGPPPYGPRKVPHYNRHGGSCACGCLKWCCCCFYSCCRCCICAILIFIILVVAIAVALFYLLKPNIPSYNIESVDVKGFDIRKNNKLYSDVVVVVKAENPNEELGFDYLDNEVRLMYSGSELCEGGFPPFLQPGKNTTTINVELKGESDFDSEKQNNLMNDQKAKNIPLLITVKLPIRVVVDDIVHLRKFVVYVNCSLVIDRLQPNKSPSILNKDFNYEIEF